MNDKSDKDTAVERKGPSRYRRKKRAANAARHRWKGKWQLVPGSPLSWSERSVANKQRHLAASRKGGETTGRQIKEQQRLFWRWYHGDCKAQVGGVFRTVVETFERIEAAYVQRYGYTGPKWIAWDGFFAHVFKEYVLVACGRKNPAVIERDMWALYDLFMEADDAALYGGLLRALHEYEDAQEEKRVRIGLWRSKNSAPTVSKRKKKA